MRRATFILAVLLAAAVAGLGVMSYVRPYYVARCHAGWARFVENQRGAVYLTIDSYRTWRQDGWHLETGDFFAVEHLCGTAVNRWLPLRVLVRSPWPSMRYL